MVLLDIIVATRQVLLTHPLRCITNHHIIQRNYELFPNKQHLDNVTISTLCYVDFSEKGESQNITKSCLV